MGTLLQRLFAKQPYDRVHVGDGPKLRRVLGAPALIAVGLGTMLGGIFTTIGVGTQQAGPGVVLSFALSGLACVFVSLCYAELASMVPIAGSAYTYAYAALGEIIAWIIGWDLILEYGISVAPTAASWSGSVQLKLLDYHITLPQWAQVAHLVFSGGRLDMAHSQIDVLAIAITLFLTAVLAIGIRESASTNNILVVVQVVAIVVFAAGLFGAIHPGNYHPLLPHGVHGIVAGAATVFFAYIGFDTVTVASEEAQTAGTRRALGRRRLAADRRRPLHGGRTRDRRRRAVAAHRYQRGHDGRGAARRQQPVALEHHDRRDDRRNDDRHADVAARSDSHLLRDGARSHAAARRRTHQPGDADAARADPRDGSARRDLGGRRADRHRDQPRQHRYPVGVRDRVRGRVRPADHRAAGATAVPRPVRPGGRVDRCGPMPVPHDRRPVGRNVVAVRDMVRGRDGRLRILWLPALVAGAPRKQA